MDSHILLQWTSFTPVSIRQGDLRAIASRANLAASKYLNAQSDSQAASPPIYSLGPPFGGDAAYRPDPQAGAGEQRRNGSHFYWAFQLFPADRRPASAGGPQFRPLAVRAQTAAATRFTGARPAAHRC